MSIDEQTILKLVELRRQKAHPALGTSLRRLRMKAPEVFDVAYLLVVKDLSLETVVDLMSGRRHPPSRLQVQDMAIASIAWLHADLAVGLIKRQRDKERAA